MTVCGVSGEAGIADYGVVSTAELDDSLSYEWVANDPGCASGPALAEVISVQEPEYGCASGYVPHADVEVVGS
jgi:hypothetical protein